MGQGQTLKRDPKYLFFLPTVGLWPPVANILNPSSFPMEAQADLSVLKFLAVGLGLFDFLSPANVWVAS